MKEMRLSLTWILVALALAALLQLASPADLVEDVARAEEPAPRGKPLLRKLLDFDSYRKLFGKTYHSLAEQAVRAKLYLARAFKVFVVSVGYQHRLRSSYLAVNHLSDRTPAELSRMYMRPEQVEQQLAAMAGKQEPPVAEMKELEQTLDELAHRRATNELEAALQQELAGGLGRSKRATDVRGRAERRLPAEQLVRVPQPPREPEQVAAKLERRPKSNNPDYEAPALASFGQEQRQEEEEAPMAAGEESLLTQLPGLGYLRSVLSGAGTLLGAPQEQVAVKRQRQVKDKVYVDHRRSNCFLQPRHQGSCGSCYIFSTIALLEWQLCMESGKLVGFSEQYVLDCGKRASRPLDGCSGGVEFKVLNFAQEFGLELRRSYPYVGAEEECPYPDSTPASHMGFFRLHEDVKWKPVRWNQLEKELERAPVLVGVLVPVDFPHYGGGVDSAAECRAGFGHSMLLVGDGVQDGQEYWLFRNSHSADWGEAGHWRLAKSADCFPNAAGIRFEGQLSRGRQNPNHDPALLAQRQARRKQADQAKRRRQEQSAPAFDFSDLL